ncbi:hypothetical protein BJX66DRAFT_349514 [Aspergillus keveii]|uniref:Uncharacterized protein n=1 Tax=Aspergillus keveii TaxID=714993 RepID=A0ABR4FJD5_9EURO
MVADQQTAIVLLDTDRAVGRWTQYGDLVRYGWRKDEDTDADDSVGQNTLADGGIFKELSIDAAENEKVLAEHSIDVMVDGRKYEGTGAYYNSLFNIDSGLIVADANSSPRAEKKDWPAEDLPPLKQWSDVVFLLWQRIAGSNVQRFQHHIQYAIANTDTVRIMQKAVGEDDTFSDWESFQPLRGGGKTFRPDSDEYYALLNSPNGFGIAWFLIQHKAQLGIKTVSEITVFGADGDPCLYFAISPVG